MSQKVRQSLNSAAAQMGRRGGSSGKGISKRRGNVSYYRDLQRKSVASRAKNAAKNAGKSKEN